MNGLDRDARNFKRPLAPLKYSNGHGDQVQMMIDMMRTLQPEVAGCPRLDGRAGACGAARGRRVPPSAPDSGIRRTERPEPPSAQVAALVASQHLHCTWQLTGHELYEQVAWPWPAPGKAGARYSAQSRRHSSS